MTGIGQQLSAGTDVSLDDCFPIDDAPARSASCIGWGPHNVLQVCTRWSVSFYLTSLLSPAQQRHIRHHPLCRRTDVESVETVVGAKWATALLPEVFYPASARVCVQTTSNLVVYRVTRHGTTRVEVSCGIGIACCRRSSQPLHNADGLPENAADSPTTAADRSSRVDFSHRTSGYAEPAKVESSAARKRKQSAKTVAAPQKKGRATAAVRTRRRRRSSSDDEDESDTESTPSSDSSSSESGSSGCDSDAKTSFSANAATPKRCGRPSAARISASRAVSEKTEEESAGVETTTAVAGKQSERDASARSDANAGKDDHVAQVRNSAATLLDYAWISNDDLVVLTTLGLHVVPFYGELSDDESPQTRALPRPLYTWNGLDEAAALGFCGPTPVRLATISASGLVAQASAPALAFLQRTLVVVSSYLLRVLHVSSAPPSSDAAITVQLVQHMEVPALVSVPTAVCAVAAALRRSTVGESDDAAAEVVAFLAAPSLVLRGRFVLALPSGATSASSSSSRSCAWVSDAQFGAEQLVGEVSLRELVVAPFSTAAADEEALPLGDSAFKSVLRPNAVASSSPSAAAVSNTTVCTAVLGIGERSLVQYLLSGPSCVTLFRCPLLAGRSEMPARRCAGVSGVALHPAGAVAVVAVQSGHASHEPVHLWPISADGTETWLHRFVELAVPLRADGEPLKGGTEASVAAVTLDGADASVCNVKSLTRSQMSSSYFLRECLLSASTAQSNELHCYACALQETRQMPSSETLKRCRTLALSANAATAAEPASLLIADLGLRHTYLQLRAQHGVSLFLRWPLPVSAFVGEGQGGSAVSVVASASAMATEAKSWPWWRLLRHIWASCPWDRPVLHELVLSNAVRILAKRHGYANMSFAASERFRERAGAPAGEGTLADRQATRVSAGRCATDPDTVDVDGARCFVEAYVKQQETLLNLVAADSVASNDSFATVLTAADCESLAFLNSRGVPARASINNTSLAHSSAPAAAHVHWCVSQVWVSHLKNFLSCVAGDNVGGSLPASLSPPFSSSSSGRNAPISGPVRFPCSLCDRDAAAPFRLSLSSTSQHVPLATEATGEDESAASASARAVVHTTLFSGTTLSPLSFFSPDYVLTRCVSCGLSDYADGPLCRVCGGLLE